MITKKIAGDLYGNGFMLQRKDKTIFGIMGINDTGMLLSIAGVSMAYTENNQIGTDYHILARPLSDLTKEITHKGETFVPIVECAKIAFPALSNDWEYYDEISKAISKYGVTFGFDKEFYTVEATPVPSQMDLFDKLREWNFSIGLLEGSWIPVTDNNNPYK